ncbi:hypothetical protein SAMN05518683_113104 [Salibacterium halotolerans]|uniref:Uncharacterized protein n=1 Tax=Salibacterium halotolerans TaxID=1884432 RepID=A0A1I5UJP7_9BACI|nr:hypothetical protein SAMN05518683_113104 [Salibacterium halotolerans]
MKLVLLIGLCIAFMVSILSAGFEDKPHKH